MAKQTATVTEREAGGGLAAWLNISSLCPCITHPLTAERTYSPSHSIPIPAAGHTSAQDYQISSWRFGLPVCVCETRGANSGRSAGGTQQTGLPADGSSHKPAVHLPQPSLSRSSSIHAPLSPPLTAHLLTAASVPRKHSHLHSAHAHTPPSRLPVVNYSWRGGRLTPAG